MVRKIIRQLDEIELGRMVDFVIILNINSKLIEFLKLIRVGLILMFVYF